MALNDYEYINEARSVASSLGDIKDLITDGIPDQQQILSYLAAISALVTPIQSVLSAEEQAKFEVKFSAVVGLILIAREARKLEDGKLKDNLLAITDFGQKELEINLPDEA